MAAGVFGGDVRACTASGALNTDKLRARVAAAPRLAASQPSTQTQIRSGRSVHVRDTHGRCAEREASRSSLVCHSGTSAVAAAQGVRLTPFANDPVPIVVWNVHSPSVNLGRSPGVNLGRSRAILASPRVAHCSPGVTYCPSSPHRAQNAERRGATQRAQLDQAERSLGTVGGTRTMYDRCN